MECFRVSLIENYFLGGLGEVDISINKHLFYSNVFEYLSSLYYDFKYPQ